MKKIHTKKQFYQLWQEGKLGNKPKTWNALDYMFSSGERLLHNKKYSIRTNLPGSKLTYLHKSPEEVENKLLEYCQNQNIVLNEFYINECPEDAKLLIQGEVFRHWEGLTVTYSCTPNLNMRQAMEKPSVAQGLKAKYTLEKYLNQRALDMMYNLLDEYDSIIEFSSYSYNLGFMPVNNTLIWEVRNY